MGVSVREMAFASFSKCERDIERVMGGKEKKWA